VALDVLLRNGKIPDLLTPFVAQMVYQGVDTDELDKLLSVEKLTEQSTEMLELIDAVVCAAFVEPRIVEEPQEDDEISIADVELWQIGVRSFRWRFCQRTTCAGFCSDKRQVWSLYRTATATSQRPSSLVQIEDAWAAFQFDSAVVFFGNAIEGAAQETVWVGSEKDKRLEPKYTMSQLLDADFRLPSPESKGQEDGLAALKAMARNVRGVKLHKVD
jgi:hypothetical protein